MAGSLRFMRQYAIDSNNNYPLWCHNCVLNNLLPTSQETSWATIGSEHCHNQIRREACPNMSKANWITCWETYFFGLHRRQGDFRWPFGNENIPRAKYQYMLNLVWRILCYFSEKRGDELHKHSRVQSKWNLPLESESPRSGSGCLRVYKDMRREMDIQYAFEWMMLCNYWVKI